MSVQRKLTKRQHILLCEALRRHTRFNLRDLKKPLGEAWTGLGRETEYRPALNAGLMERVHPANFPHLEWWRLTEQGVKIVEGWLAAGFTFEDIEADRLPPRELAQPLAR